MDLITFPENLYINFIADATSYDKRIYTPTICKPNKLLHAYVQCVFIVWTKYQIASSKAVLGVDRPIKALSRHKQKPYKGIIVQVLTAVILSKIIFFQPDSFMHLFNVSILYRQSIKPLH